MNKPLPRYQKISDELVSDIFTHNFPMGSLLLTKQALCERFGMCQFTYPMDLERI